MRVDHGARRNARQWNPKEDPDAGVSFALTLACVAVGVALVGACHWLENSLADAAGKAERAADAIEDDGPVVRRQTWCPSPEQRASVPVEEPIHYHFGDEIGPPAAEADEPPLIVIPRGEGVSGG